MTNQGRLMCRQSDRRYEPPSTAEQTGNKRTIRVLPKPDKLISSRVRGLLGIWVSGGEAEGLHFVGVLSFGDEFREDGALGYIQEKFGEALA